MERERKREKTFSFNFTTLFKQVDEEPIYIQAAEHEKYGMYTTVRVYFIIATCIFTK